LDFYFGFLLSIGKTKKEIEVIEQMALLP